MPGWEGAYSVKWLSTLTLATKEQDGFWVATGYRYPTKRVAPGAAVDAKDMAPLVGLVVKSLITTPLDGAVVAPGQVAVAGFAWAGETAIAKVDVSIDGGATWQPARLTGQAVKYAWRRFEFAFDATRQDTHTILSRATDANGQAQTDRAAMESVRVSVECPGSDAHRGEGVRARVRPSSWPSWRCSRRRARRVPRRRPCRKVQESRWPRRHVSAVTSRI